METLAVVARQPLVLLADIVPAIDTWPDLVGSSFSKGNTNIVPGPEDLGVDHFVYNCALHQNSLNTERIRISIEMEVFGAQPLLDVRFGAHGEIAPTPSIPIQLPNGNTLHEFTIVRPVGGEPFGSYLDLFQVEMRDCILRRFDAVDLGAKGDLNLDQQVDLVDFGIVVENLYQTGDIGVEGGDANLDGTVDSADAATVLEGMQE